MNFSRFAVVSGKGVSSFSALNAFDNALLDAGIGNYNLVPVSSILPENIRLVSLDELNAPEGSVVYVVLGKALGKSGDLISAGVKWALGVDRKGRRYGIIMEDGGEKSRYACERDLDLKLKEAVEVRGLNVESSGGVVESMVVPRGKYGAVVAAVVLF